MNDLQSHDVLGRARSLNHEHHTSAFRLFFAHQVACLDPTSVLPAFPGDWTAASNSVPKYSQVMGFYSFTWIAFNAALLFTCCPAHLRPGSLRYIAFLLIIFINVHFFSPRLPSFISKAFNHLFSFHLSLSFLTCAIKMPVKYSRRNTDLGWLRSCWWDAYCYVIKTYGQ